jgi:hypothetical protein
MADDPEFAAAFVGYVERGTRLAMRYSQGKPILLRSADFPLGLAPRTTPPIGGKAVGELPGVTRVVLTQIGW